MSAESLSSYEPVSQSQLQRLAHVIDAYAQVTGAPPRRRGREVHFNAQSPLLQDAPDFITSQLPPVDPSAVTEPAYHLYARFIPRRFARETAAQSEDAVAPRAWVSIQRHNYINPQPGVPGKGIWHTLYFITQRRQDLGGNDILDVRKHIFRNDSPDPEQPPIILGDDMYDMPLGEVSAAETEMVIGCIAEETAAWILHNSSDFTDPSALAG